MIDALPKALPRNFASSGASENSVKQTDCPVCQTRPMSPSPGPIVCNRKKLSSAMGAAAACCKIFGGTSTSGGQPLEINAGVKFPACSIGHVKRAAMRVQNTRCAFDDEPMQIAEAE